MINLSNSLPKSIPELDLRCSVAGTRSGIIALLLSMLAMSLVPALQGVKALNALEEYVVLRANLELAINLFEGTPCWRQIRGSEIGQKAAKVWNLDEFVDHPFPCFGDLPSSASSNSDLKKKKEVIPQILKEDDATKLRDSLAPLPKPTGFRVQVQKSEPLYSLKLVNLALDNLDNQNLLEKAKSVASYKLKHSIIRWETLRTRLILKKVEGFVKYEFKKESAKSSHLTSSYKFSMSGAKHSEILTYETARQLAKYEVPDMKLIDEIREQKAWVRLPRNPLLLQPAVGATFLEFSMFLSVAYYWLILQEARQSKFYPAPGTLFRMFSRTRFSQSIFLIFVLLPCVSAIILAQESNTINFSNIEWIEGISLSLDWIFAWLIVIISIAILGMTFGDAYHANRKDKLPDNELRS
ncbi:hypothetical protein [Nitrospira sp. M1]